MDLFSASLGVPNVESPFFKQIFSNPDIDDETRRIATDLNRDGFAVFNFPDEDFDEMAEVIKSSLHGQYRWQHWLETGYDNGEGLRLMDAWMSNKNVKRIAMNQWVINLLSKLYGRNAFPFQTLNFPVGSQQHFHSDTVHFNSVPERFMCGVWTALEDITADAGPLFYYPGSHKWPIYNNEHLGICSAESPTKFTQKTYEPMWRALVEAHGIEPVPFLAKKGQSAIWLSNLLHGGLKQLDKNKTRWSQVTHFYFDDCAYYSPMFSDPFYGSINFFELKNIVTEEKVKNQYAGHEIPQDYIEQSRARYPNIQMAVLPLDFDPVLYLTANSDVREAGFDPFMHYKLHGWKEGRKLRP